MDETYKRLLDVAKLLKGTKNAAQVAKLLNVSGQTMTNWKSRGVPKDKLLEISQIIGCNPYTILSGQAGLPAEQNILAYNASDLARFRLSPLISWVSAGQLCNSEEPADFNYAEEWYVCPVKHSEMTYALRVIGDSMSPEYQDGWLIFVDPMRAGDAKHNDDVVVCDPSGKTTFKRLQDTPDGKYLLALNPDFKPRRIDVEENTMICGVVIFKGVET